MYPGALDKTFSSLSIVNLEVIDSLAIPCWGASEDSKGFDYIREMMSMTLTPLAIAALMLIAFEVIKSIELEVKFQLVTP